MARPSIRDVPCGSCVHGYNRDHQCDAPMFCACDRTDLHPDVAKPDPTDVPEFGPMTDLAPLIERINADVRALAAITRPTPNLVDLLTSDVALAAFREAWLEADAEGAKGDRVRRGMVAAIEAVS